MTAKNSIALKHFSGHGDSLILDAISTSCSLNNCITTIWQDNVRNSELKSGELNSYIIRNPKEIKELPAEPGLVSFQVSSRVGEGATIKEKSKFLDQYSQYIGVDQVPGVKRGHIVTTDYLVNFVDTYLPPIKEAHFMYSLLLATNHDELLCEISFVDSQIVQNPIDLFFIIKLLIDHNIDFFAIEPRIALDPLKSIPLDLVEEFCSVIGAIGYTNESFQYPELSLSISKVLETEHLSSVFKNSNCGLYAKSTILFFHRALLQSLKEISDELGGLEEHMNRVLYEKRNGVYTEDQLQSQGAGSIIDMVIASGKDTSISDTSSGMMLLMQDLKEVGDFDYQSFDRLLKKKIYHNYIKPIFG